MSSRSRLSSLVALALLGGCTSSPPEFQKPLNANKTLMCPTPGDLPFKLQTHGWQSKDNATLAASHTQNKDEASDTLGNPGGLSANTYLADTGKSESGPLDYRGRKARTTPSAGLLASALPNEWVSLFTYDDTRSEWHFLQREKTGSDGYYDMLGTDFVGAPGQPIYSLLEADGSCATHTDWLEKPGTQFVVADIDGTLTSADAELIMQLGDETYQPKMMAAANTLLQTWAAKGYFIVYLTARLHLYRPETVEWLAANGFPQGPLITSAMNNPQPYKTAWMNRMIQDFGWKPIAAYGNADTDIGAYQAAGLDNSIIFIVGPYGGDMGSTPIANMDFSDHIASYVSMQPDSTND